MKAERWRTRGVELLADAGRALLVVGLCWIGVDMSRAQTPAAVSVQPQRQQCSSLSTKSVGTEANTIASRMFKPVPANEPHR